MGRYDRRCFPRQGLASRLRSSADGRKLLSRQTLATQLPKPRLTSGGSGDFRRTAAALDTSSARLKPRTVVRPPGGLATSAARIDREQRKAFSEELRPSRSPCSTRQRF